MRGRPEFSTYVAARSPRLLRTAYLLCHDRGIAEDLVQTALAKAWVAWNRVGENPEPYILRIIVNTHASWWRRKWRGEVPTDELPDVPASPAAGAVEDRDMLWRALGRLRPHERAAVVLRYFADFDHNEVAAILDCSPATARSQIRRALGKLRVDASLRTLSEKS